MTNALILITVNALLYWITFIFYQIKKKRFDLGSILLLVFAISFSSSIYFFLNTSVDFTKYSILPSLYLFFLYYDINISNTEV